MNKISQLYDRWLKAEHLRGPVVARVTMAEIAQFDGKNNKESKYVLHFFERNLKPLILNKGNALAMADLTGTDDEATWCNVVIMLTPSKLANGNGTIILSSPPVQNAPNGNGSNKPSSGAGESAVEGEDEVPF